MNGFVGVFRRISIQKSADSRTPHVPATRSGRLAPHPSGVAAERLFVIERKLIIDDSGADVPAGLSTWHRIHATGAAAALASFTALQNAEILGTVSVRGDGATAIIEVGQRAYRLIVVPGDRASASRTDVGP